MFYQMGIKVMIRKVKFNKLLSQTNQGYFLISKKKSKLKSNKLSIIDLMLLKV